MESSVVADQLIHVDVVLVNGQWREQNRLQFCTT